MNNEELTKAIKYLSKKVEDLSDDIGDVISVINDLNDQVSYLKNLVEQQIFQNDWLNKGVVMSSFRDTLEIEEVAKRISSKLNFLFQSLLDLEDDGLSEYETRLGLAFIIQELQKEVSMIREYFEKLK